MTVLNSRGSLLRQRLSPKSLLRRCGLALKGAM